MHDACEWTLLQAMGENVAALIVDIGRSLRQGEDKVEEDEKLIFFDVLGLFMVRIKRSMHTITRCPFGAMQRICHKDLDIS